MLADVIHPKSNMAVTSAPVCLSRSFFLLRAPPFAVLSRCRAGTCQARHKSQWQLVGALAVERKPIIAKEMNPLERRYFDMLLKMEVEASLLSDHELRLAEEEKKETTEGSERVKLQIQTARDLAEQWTAERANFSPAPRLTDADKMGDVRTTDRRLDTPLLLVMHQKLGDGHAWVLPQTPHREGETLRQTAERALVEICGDSLQVLCLGNAPAGFYKYNYPKGMQEEFLGAKVFFFKAHLRAGSPTRSALEASGLADDFAWLSPSELASRLQDRYLKSVRTFLMESQSPDHARLLKDALRYLEPRSTRTEQEPLRETVKA